jgi:hypothetical protein
MMLINGFSSFAAASLIIEDSSAKQRTAGKGKSGGSQIVWEREDV